MGGDQPTVTDANLVLRRLNPEFFLGGDMKVYPELSLKAVKRISDHYLMDVNEAAEGILRIVVTSMAGAIRTMTVRRGIDPRGFSMVSFGGAGPLHAALIARELQIPRVIVSTMPGNFSAWGMLQTDIRRDYVQTRFGGLGGISSSDLTGEFGRLESGAIKDMVDEGISRERSELIRGVDVRYRGQGHAITLALPAGELADRDLEDLASSFDRMHLERYLHNAPEESKEIAAIRLTAIGRMKKVSLPKIRAGVSSDPGAARKSSREVFLDGEFQRCVVYEREKLLAGNVVMGPAIIEERVSTTLLLAGQSLAVDEYGHLVITATEGER
jgi:N-methylhydantoinase A